MKTKSLFFAALVVFSSAVAFAGKEDPRNTGLAVVPVKGSEVYKVIYKGESQGAVKLNLYNASGSLILSEKFRSTDGFIVPVNFKGLSSGNYTFELVDAAGTKVEKVSYQPKKNAKSVHISKLKEANRFLVSIASAGADVVDLKIFDENRNLIYTESNFISGDFARVYKLAENGTYTFEVTDNAGLVKTMQF